MRRSSSLKTVAVGALVLLSSSSTWSDAVSREDRIKAALIFKLVKFVEWPSAALTGKDPLEFCALGSSGVADALAAGDGKPVRDRLAHVRTVDALSPAEVKGCHVLYIPGTARESGGGVPAALRGHATLTVSDAPDFARRGGMIGLGRGENKISFEINLRTAREGGLAPGASLLELATVVE